MELLATGRQQRAGAVVEAVPAEFGISQPAVSQHFESAPGVRPRHPSGRKETDGSTLSTLTRWGRSIAGWISYPAVRTISSMPSARSWLEASVHADCPPSPRRRTKMIIDIAEQIGAISRQVEQQQSEFGEIVTVTLEHRYPAEVADISAGDKPTRNAYVVGSCRSPATSGQVGTSSSRAMPAGTS